MAVACAFKMRVIFIVVLIVAPVLCKPASADGSSAPSKKSSEQYSHLSLPYSVESGVLQLPSILPRLSITVLHLAVIGLIHQILALFNFTSFLLALRHRRRWIFCSPHGAVDQATAPPTQRVGRAAHSTAQSSMLLHLQHTEIHAKCDLDLIFLWPSR